ncbi:carbamate kinase [Blastococcus sp. TF02A-26]|uniref:carbamate kinase n=1 Tax=Blastococcus sp. TF02A-26 TaxID=2250577 RepID=UPI000DEB9689|nr:carbamate kinase [Blastococcus sp. TF02A-26]RBY80794.1 carbamate kinase [Blastococcus sp. TF02A-26]
MRVLVALGGNALLERGEAPDEAVQRRHVRRAAAALAPLAAAHQLVVSHGNGPQVGVLALESVRDPSLHHPYPLDALGAATQGMIGYWLAQELANAGVRAPVLAVVTQTVVDADDPAFGAPSKFIGESYDRAAAESLAAAHGWRIAPDGDRWRRVVPSPRPLRIVEEGCLRALVAGGAVLVCGGGGGVPVVADGRGATRGVEAVVDKDMTAALLAQRLGADRLLLLTDVPAVMRDFGTPAASEVRRMDLAEAGALSLPAGSMGPKVEACREFVLRTGGVAAIGALGDAAAILDGRAGTTVVPGP